MPVCGTIRVDDYHLNEDSYSYIIFTTNHRQLYSHEHGIKLDGRGDAYANRDTPLSTHFVEKKSGIYRPRALFIDLEEQASFDILCRDKGGRYDLNQFVTKNSCISSNYMQGRWELGKDACELGGQNIRQMVEECDSFGGFAITHSLGGGTGGGFTNQLLDRCFNAYSKQPILHFPVFPNLKNPRVGCEAYNVLLSLTGLCWRASGAIVYHNAALDQYYKTHIRNKYNSNVHPHTNYNRLIARHIAGVTGPLRYTGDTGSLCNVSFATFCESLAADSKYKILLPSLSLGIPNEMLPPKPKMPKRHKKISLMKQIEQFDKMMDKYNRAVNAIDPYAPTLSDISARAYTAQNTLLGGPMAGGNIEGGYVKSSVFFYGNSNQLVHSRNINTVIDTLSSLKDVRIRERGSELYSSVILHDLHGTHPKHWHLHHAPQNHTLHVATAGIASSTYRPLRRLKATCQSMLDRKMHIGSFSEHMQGMDPFPDAMEDLDQMVDNYGELTAKHTRIFAEDEDWQLYKKEMRTIEKIAAKAKHKRRKDGAPR